ncbi:MAG: PQQ-binding-like beta-propeller repeat protein [Thermoanaerobaculia bacterium]
MPLPPAAAPNDWPQWRGPNRDGVSRETGLLKSWPTAGPRVLWRTSLGEGYSGISVVGSSLFTLYSDRESEYVVSLDAATGKESWRFRLDSAYRDGQGNGPRSTPTVVEGVVYALGAQGRLAALQASSGMVLWQRDLKETLDAQPPRWGVSTSPLIEGDLLILDAGGQPDASVAALDRRTGELVWSVASDKAGYSAPVAITVDGLRQVLVFSGTQLVSVTPKDGKLLWRKSWRTAYDVNAATPIFIPPDRVFVASGYDTGGVMLRVKRQGDRATVEEVWRSRDMKNQFSSSVFVDGHIYGFDNATLKAIDARTGEEAWRERPGLGHGSVTYADGHFYILGERGKLVLVEATPEAYREKASVQVLRGKCWTVPTLANGRLFVRNEKEIVALDVKGS